MILDLPIEIILYIFETNYLTKIKDLKILNSIFKININIQIIAINRIKLFLKLIINKYKMDNKIITRLKRQSLRRGLQVSACECVQYKPYMNTDICVFCFRNKKKHMFKQHFISKNYSEYTF